MLVSHRVYKCLLYLCNTEIPRIYFGYSLQLNIFILDSGAAINITPDISDFYQANWLKHINISRLHMEKISKQNKQEELK